MRSQAPRVVVEVIMMVALVMMGVLSFWLLT